MGSPWQTARFLLGALAILAITGCGQHGVADTVASRESPSRHHPARTPSSPPTEHRIPGIVRRSVGPTRTCRATDLTVRLRRGEGATGHYASLLYLRNVSSARCILSGYPPRVTLFEPGRPPVIARRGGFFERSLPPSRAMDPGGVTTLVIETDTYCNARPTGGRPGPFYDHVSVELTSGVLNSSTRRARALDVGCGAFVTKFGRWK